MKLYIHFLSHFRGGSRKAKRVSIHKQHPKTVGKDDNTSIEMEPFKNPAPAVTVDATNENIENQGKMEENEGQEQGEVGWGTMLFNFFKILLLGVAVFSYDIYGTL